MGRHRNRWNTACALMAVGLMIVSGGCAGSPDPQASAGPGSEQGSTPQGSAGAPEEDKRVLTYPAEPLAPGVNQTLDTDGSTSVRFKVPQGWSGEQSGDTGWALFWGPGPRRSKASLNVDELDMKFEEAIAGFKAVKNLKVPEPEPMKIGGQPALLFAAEVTKGKNALLDEALDVPIDVVGWFETRQVFIDLGRNAMIVRVELPKGEKYLPAALKVIKTFRFGT
jgi:hypothetical protein